jgi:tetratricopeptide (TPR) repeat protein
MSDDSEASDITRRRSEKLAEEGYQRLDDGEPEAALKVAAELEELRYTAAFEIASLAHAQLGDLAAAVATLRRGVDLAPSVWLNWQLLGNYLSDLEQYEEAASAYETALGCPLVDESSVRFNQAVLASRRGQHVEALSYLGQVTGPELATRALSARVEALAGLGRFDEALRAGEAALREAATDDAAELGSLAASLVRARAKGGASAEETIASAVAALEEYDRSNAELLWLIRHADEQYSPAAKYYRMMIDAKIPFTDPLARHGRGYIVNYDVVADSVEEALAFVARMEPPAVRGNLLVDEQEVLADRPEEPKGVYKRSERHYYRREE